MSNFKASEQDQKWAENIHRQYISREDNKIEQLQKLDNKVKFPGKIVASILGNIGALIMGSGMSLIMVWKNTQLGLLLGAPGVVAAVLAYPVYALITTSRRKKYASEMIRLSDDVIED
ncbi:MAG: hypothetical protein ACI3XG_12305 [Faecousia sp.]